MKNVVLTCYFTGKNDPQFSGTRHRSNNFDAIYLWLKSLTVCGLQGVIFTDNLTRVHSQFANSATIVPYQLKTGWTILEERHQCYLNYLSGNYDISRVVFTDLFDCEFYRDPFPLLTDDYDLMAGYGGRLLKPIHGNAWIEAEIARAYGETMYPDMPVLCAGCWGARRDDAVQLLRAMVYDFKTINPVEHVDMSVFIRNAYDMFPAERILLGEPFSSKFKRYEISGDFAIRHK